MYFILFYFILFYFILFYFILFILIERMPKGKERVSDSFYCVYWYNVLCTVFGILDIKELLIHKHNECIDVLMLCRKFELIPA